MLADTGTVLLVAELNAGGGLQLGDEVAAGPNDENVGAKVIARRADGRPVLCERVPYSQVEEWRAGTLANAGRLGGEEFVLGVSGIAGADLRRLGEAVRTELAECPFNAIAPALQITVSIGIAQGLADGPFGSLYRLADDALYAAKRAGRNRVVTVEDGSDHGVGSTFTQGAGAPHSAR